MEQPRLNRSPVLPILHEEQKTWAPAGNSTSRFYTPFSATRDQLRRHVADNPGVSMKDAVDAIRHHYASPQSARQSLTQWIELGRVPGVRIEREGRTVRLYPSTT